MVVVDSSSLELCIPDVLGPGWDNCEHSGIIRKDGVGPGLAGSI